MPEYLAPGVYVEEVDTGAKPIEGVSTTTSGMVGVTERGPENVATLVTSFADFQRQFGGYLNDDICRGSTWFLPHAVEGFFTNGGKRLYIVRVLPDSATSACNMLFDLRDTPAIPARLAARGVSGDQLLLLDDSAAVLGADAWVLLEDGQASEYVQFSTAPAGVVTIDSPILAALWPSGTVVDGLDAGANVLGTTTLATDVVAGEFLLPVANAGILAGSVNYRIGTGAGQEMHAHADNGAVSLSAPLEFNHNLNAPVREPSISFDHIVRNLTGTPTNGNTTISLDNRTLLVNAPGPAAGQRLQITNTTKNTTEVARVSTIVVPRSPAPDAGNVNLEMALGQVYDPGDVVSIELLDPVARTLTQDAPRGTIQVSLNSRAGILDPVPPGNQVHFLRFTDAAGNFEFARIDTLDAPRVPGADPGLVTLESPLQRDYVTGDAVALLRDTDNDNGVTFLAWDADPDDRALVLGDSGAYGPGSYIRIENIGAANSEYSVVPAGPVPFLRIADSPFRASHPATTRVLGRDPVLMVQAIDRGIWGNMVRVLVANETSPLLRETRPDTPAPATNPTLTLRTTVGVEPGTILEFFRRVAGTETIVFRQKVTSVNGNVVGFGAAGLIQAVTTDMLVRSVEFEMTVELVRINPRTFREEVVFSETYRQLSLDYRHLRYIVRVVGPIFVNDTVTPRRRDGHTEGESSLIRITDVLYPDWPRPNAATQAQVEAALRRGLDTLQFTPPGGQPRSFGLFFTGGNDDIGAIIPDAYRGSDGANPPQTRTGIFALKNIDEISIVAVPGQTDQTIQEALINHCELMRYRVAVLDSRERDGTAEVQEHRGLYDTKYAAIYYPWLRINDPFPENPRILKQVSIPPSGHIMGIYARSDIERGVHKAPANEVIRGIQDLEFKLMKEEQDILNPRNINVLRNFRENNRGLRVWGARTLSSDPDWKYLNVRRLFIFVEHSIDRGTQWVVFEPNNEALWERVKRVVRAFLTQVWRDGALMGKTKEEAFFVNCDRTTMTQADIDNGRLIVQVGIAPVKPAEFVIFRIGQWAGGSFVEEG